MRTSKEIKEKHDAPKNKLFELGFHRINETTINESELLFYAQGARIVILQLYPDGGWEFYSQISMKNNIDEQFKELELLSAIA